MALHAVQVKPVCTNIFPCWRCVSQKNLTRIQIIPNASPVQLSILTPQNYIAILGTWGPRENRFTIPLKGPVILCAFGWGEISPASPAKSAKSLEALEILQVEYRINVRFLQVWLGKKNAVHWHSQGKSYMKKWMFFPRQANRNSNPSCTILELLTGDRGKRHFEKAVWRSTALDKERLSI